MKKHFFATLSIMFFAACTTLNVNAEENPESDGMDAVIQEPTGQWINDGNGWWYENPDGSYPSNGWYEIEDEWYIFDESGYIITGWYESKDKWYYLNPNGRMAECWLNDGGNWYYMMPDSGAMVTGWQEIKDSWYFFDEKGKMKTGWLEQGSSWYYLNPDGTMAEGWTNDNGTWYYMNPDSGTMTTGWQLIDENWYYLGKKGAMVTGWFKLDNDWYYCDSNGVMAANTFVDGCYINRNGIWIEDAEEAKTEQALAVAWDITDFVNSLNLQTDVERVDLAGYIVSQYCAQATYTMSGDNYDKAYGVFIVGEFSCAGATRALGMVLDCMGYEWEHVNEHLYTHQWCRLTMDGQIGWADGQIGAGYGEHPLASML